MIACEETPQGGVARTTNFRYDLNGQSVAKELPNNVLETDAHDAQGRTTEIVYYSNSVAGAGVPVNETYRSNLQYDKAGNLIENGGKAGPAEPCQIGW